MDRLPFVSVIIPTYNRARLLQMTVDSFLAQDYPEDRYEIIISNNNSTDETSQIIESYIDRYRHVRWICELRQGVHYARNSAAKISRGDILYFTDDDMVADPALLKEIVTVFAEYPAVGSATGRIIGMFEVPPPLWVRKHLINMYLSLTDENMPHDIVVSDIDMVFSCHEAVRREAFFYCGGFNPENTAGTWIGDGETGLGIKLKKAGYRFAYTPYSVTRHMIPPERMTLAYLIRRFGNQANCDSFTCYREHRDRRRILNDLLKRHPIHFINLLRYSVRDILKGEESWHFIPARLNYILKRICYDLKLYFDPGFRKLAEVDDWLDAE